MTDKELRKLRRIELLELLVEQGEEMERLLSHTIDPLPGVVECSCNVIFSRIKDIKGLRL